MSQYESKVKALVEIFDAHLAHRQEEPGRVVSHLVAGGPFEHWLATEMRLVLEQCRSELELDEMDPCGRGETNRHIWWIDNEYRKVDLLLGRWQSPDEPEGDDGKLGIELKVIHNNKNMNGKAWEVWCDLFPKKGWGSDSKGVSMEESAYDVFAIVALVYKVYADDDAGYPVQYPESDDEFLRAVRKELDDPADPEGGWYGECRPKLICEGDFHHVTHPLLKQNHPAWLRLLAFAPEPRR